MAPRLHNRSNFTLNRKYLCEIGHNLYAWSFAHFVKIDREDNIWVTDKGSSQAVKFDPQGRVIVVFGRKQEALDEDTGPLKHSKPPLPAVDGMFRQITEITWDLEDNGYISDGYINARVAKVSKDGTWLGSWGNPRSDPGEFSTPHSIAVDAKNTVYVADRGNRRIQVFDTKGTLLRVITIDVPFDPDAKPAIGATPKLPMPPGIPQTTTPGSPWTVCITPNPHQFLYSSDAYPGRIYKMTLDGKGLGVLGMAEKQPGQFGWIHQVACPSQNTLFVAELLNWRVQKLVPHP